jgi:hypothetical protein
VSQLIRFPIELLNFKPIFTINSTIYSIAFYFLSCINITFPFPQPLEDASNPAGPSPMVCTAKSPVTLLEALLFMGMAGPVCAGLCTVCTW